MRIKAGNSMTGDGQILEVIPGSGISAALTENAAGELDLTLSAATYPGDRELSTLAAPSAVNGTQIVLSQPFVASQDAVKRGCVVIDPGTTSAEARSVSALSGDGKTLTLTAQRSWIPGKTQFISATKQIRWASQITSISVAGTTLTIVLDQSSGIVVGDACTIWGTTNYNVRYFFSAKTVSGDGLTITFDFYGGPLATETTGWFGRYSHRHFNKNFRVGDIVPVTGSVSNNTTLTVASVEPTGAYITVNEALVDEFSAGATFKWNITKVHDAGVSVLFVPDRRLAPSMYGLKGDGTAEGTTLQNLLWDSGSFNGTTYFPAGMTITSGGTPLYAPQQNLFGGGQSGTSVIAGGGVAGDWPDNSYGTLTNQSTAGLVGAVGRLILRDMKITPPPGANGYGGLINTQQPNNWFNVRVDGGGGSGERLIVRGQQGAFSTLELLGGSLTLEDASWMRFFDLDIEVTGANNTAIFVPPYSGSGAAECAVYGGHVEQAGVIAYVVDDQTGISGLTFYDVEWSPGPAGSKFWYIHPVNPNKTTAIHYAAKRCWANVATVGRLFVDDVPAGQQLDIFTVWRGQVPDFTRIAGPSDTTARDTGGNVILSPDGSLLKYGADLIGQPIWLTQTVTAHTGPHYRGDHNGAETWRIEPNGNVKPTATRPKFATPTYGATVTPDASAAEWQTITVTDANAFTVAAPTNAPTSTQSQTLTIEVLNSSGGAMGVITWNAAFVFAGVTWTNPASTKKRFVTFRWNGTKWVAGPAASADY